MILVLTLVLGALLTLFLKSNFWPNKKPKVGKDLLFFKYPRWKNLNFHHVKKAMSAEKVPKIFCGEWLPWPIPALRGKLI